MFESLERGTFWHGGYQNDPPLPFLGKRVFRVTFSMFDWTVDESGAAFPAVQRPGLFLSVDSILDVPGDSKFVLQPLKYTPRYSVIYEIPRETLIPIRFDSTPLSAAQQAALDEYRRFMDALPDEHDKGVLGDVW